MVIVIGDLHQVKLLGAEVKAKWTKKRKKLKKR